MYKNVYPAPCRSNDYAVDRTGAPHISGRLPHTTPPQNPLSTAPKKLFWRKAACCVTNPKNIPSSRISQAPHIFGPYSIALPTTDLITKKTTPLPCIFLQINFLLQNCQTPVQSKLVNKFKLYCSSPTLKTSRW